jgi:hypothetical protein
MEGIRNFFGAAKQATITKTKEDEEDVVSIDSEDESTPKKGKADKKTTADKKKEVEVVAEIDDSDDWSSSIPSILRRNR